MSLHRDLLCCENDLTVHAPPKSTYFLRNLALLLPPARPARVQVFRFKACVVQWGGQIQLGQSFEPRGCVYVLELTAVCVHAWLSPEGVRTLQSSLVLFFSLLLCGALLRAWICCIGLQRTSFRADNTCVTQFIKVWKTNNLWSAFLSERAG